MKLIEQKDTKNILSANDLKFINKSAFTLAEVLITLGIIGIVAAMTLPTLIANKKEKETVTRIKKIYSTIQQAYVQATYEKGTPDNWDLIGSRSREGAKNMLNVFVPLLKIVKTCDSGDISCWPENIKHLKGTLQATSGNSAYAVLPDGASIGMYVRDANCMENNGSTRELAHVCAVFDIDLNGLAKPNQIGVDIFSFYITKYNIIPLGTDKDINSFTRNCNKNSDGWGCAAWVIYNENMDYLHCDGLSWDGKTKCK